MKTKIVQSATKMFLTIGFKSATMDYVATNMGISKKTIYAHFKNKEDLVEASSLFIFEQIESIIQKIENKDFNPIEETFKIKETISHYLKGEKTSPEYQLKKYYPKIYNKLNKKKKYIIYSYFKKNLKRGIEQGYFRDDINIDIIAGFYYLCVTAIKNGELFSSYNNKTVFEQYHNYHLRAIASKKGLEILNTI